MKSKIIEDNRTNGSVYSDNDKIYDVTIIGGGVIGCHVARELSKYKLKICLLEKENDVACKTSSANSGIIHSGYDAIPGSMKAKLNVRGNEIMGTVTKQLDVPFKRIGSLVIAFNKEDMETIKELYDRGLENGVTGMEILEGNEVFRKEPALSNKVIGALYAPTAGIICPYELTIGAAEVAVKNGVELHLDHEVASIRKLQNDQEKDQIFCVKIKNGENVIYTKYVINAAGLYSDDISSMIGDSSFKITPRKGEYLLLDKNQGQIVNSVVFQTPTNAGKGILVTPTVDGNLLLGPTSETIDDKQDKSTNQQGLLQVKQGALKSVPNIKMNNIITSFAGLRAVPSTGDFIIEESKISKGFINVAGIESPGLTAAPAIAEYVAKILKDMEPSLTLKEGYEPQRQAIKRFSSMSQEEANSLIKKNHMYGNIICRCEKVSEAEIVEAIRRPAGARTIDGVKRRTRAGMGRCQSGFCTPKVIQILSRELGITLDEVTKSGGDSWMLNGKTK